MYSIYNKAFAGTPGLNHSQVPQKLYLQNSDGKWEWYEPPPMSIPVNFCMDTSLHGLKYIGQPKRHLCERIFWFISFMATVVMAVFLIYHLWRAYQDTPLVTVFNTKETPLSEIPFPAVTICNVNNVKKSKVDDYIAKALNPIFQSKEDHLKAYAAVIDIQHICESAKTYTQRFVDNASKLSYFEDVLREIGSHKGEYEKYVNPNRFIAEASQKCTEMIIFCIWLDEIRNCSHLFQEIETDYGYCCTFNSIPSTLLMKFFNDSRDDPEKVRGWEEANLNTDNLLFTDKMDRKYPFRQLYPGRAAGLSILLDPEMHEYACTNTDSKGFMAALNTPLDFPKMKDNGVAVPTGQEVFVGVRPDVTLTDESTKKFTVEKRQCYFGNEYDLPHYTQYTPSNCLDECMAYYTMKECHCVRYYMPRSPDEPICKANQYKCTEDVRKKIVQTGLGETCYKCLPTCSEIAYRAEVTSLEIRNSYMKTLFEAYPQYRLPKHASILHVYFSVDSTYPRLRKELYTVIDLLSNTGGLLGLCMGFSLLSLLEIIYYFSLRICCKCYRNHRRKSTELPDPTDETVIRLDQSSNIARSQWFSKVFSRPSNFQNGRVGNNDDVFKFATNSPFTDQRGKLPVYYKDPFQTNFQPRYT